MGGWWHSCAHAICADFLAHAPSWPGKIQFGTLGELAKLVLAAGLALCPRWQAVQRRWPPKHSAGLLLDTPGQVVWLDSTAARARYGRWIKGTLAQFGPFPSTGKARGGSKKAAAADQQQHQEEEVDRHYLFLKRLRHPLLLGDHLLAQRQLERERRTLAGSGGAGSGARRLRHNRGGAGSSSDSEGEEDGRGRGRGLPPLPQPIDVVVQPQTRAVVITGASGCPCWLCVHRWQTFPALACCLTPFHKVLLGMCRSCLPCLFALAAAPSWL